MLTLILLANTDPAIPTQPGLRPGLTEDQITPGLLGFVMTFGIVLIMFFLIRDMVKRVRRVRYRAQVEESHSGGATEYMGIPIMSEKDMKDASYENGFRDKVVEVVESDPVLDGDAVLAGDAVIDAEKNDACTPVPAHTTTSGAAPAGQSAPDSASGSASGPASTQGQK